MEENALKCWPKCGSREKHHRKLQKAQYFVVLLRKLPLLNIYSLTLTHMHSLSMFSPEDNLKGVPSTSGPFASTTLVSRIQGDVLTEDRITVEKISTNEP